MKKLDINLGKLPYAERIYGLTLPSNGLMYVWTWDEVFEISLYETISFKLLDDYPSDFLNLQSHYLGANGHLPILHQGGNTITYNFIPTADSVKVNYSIFDKIGTIEFQILSGDWFIASFSSCGNYLVVAEPYDFNLYQIQQI